MEGNTTGEIEIGSERGLYKSTLIKQGHQKQVLFIRMILVLMCKKL